MTTTIISSLNALKEYVIKDNSNGSVAFYYDSNEINVIEFINHVAGLMTNELLNDVDAMTVLCNLHPSAFSSASERLRDNADVCFAALYSKPLFSGEWRTRAPVLKYASTRLRSNEEILSAALKFDIDLAGVAISESIMENGDFFIRNADRIRADIGWLSKNLSNSEEFMRRFIDQGGSPSLIGDELSKNKKFIYEIVASSPYALREFKRSQFEYHDIVKLHRLGAESYAIQRIIEDLGGLDDNDETLHELVSSDAEYVKYTKRSIKYSKDHGWYGESFIHVSTESAYEDLSFLKKVVSLNGRAYFTLGILSSAVEGLIDFATYKELVAIAIRDNRLTSEELSSIQLDLMNKCELDTDINRLKSEISSLIPQRANNKSITETIPCETLSVLARNNTDSNSVKDPSEIKHFGRLRSETQSQGRTGLSKRGWQLEDISEQARPAPPIEKDSRFSIQPEEVQSIPHKKELVPADFPKDEQDKTNKPNKGAGLFVYIHTCIVAAATYQFGAILISFIYYDLSTLRAIAVFAMSVFLYKTFGWIRDFKRWWWGYDSSKSEIINFFGKVLDGVARLIGRIDFVPPFWGKVVLSFGWIVTLVFSIVHGMSLIIYKG